MEAHRITVEVNVTPGLHYFIVGLADGAVRESLRRVESALKSNGWTMPRTKIIVNLAPAGLRKSGTAFDLPIAIGVLGASEQLESTLPLEDFVMMGELSLDGALRPIRGALVVAEQVVRDGSRGLILPRENAAEAALAKGLRVYGVGHIREVIEVLRPGREAPLPMRGTQGTRTAPPSAMPTAADAPDFSHVKGQALAKRALEIAAAGSHHTLLVGPPGTGKTLLAQLLPGILPPLTPEEAIEVTKVLSIAGRLPPGDILATNRPFRSPHHSSSPSSLVGGGTPPLPGEISLAHQGVLFLDELPEFPRMALEYLRQPLEDRKISLSRVSGSVDFPASFMLVAAMNPCPCGYHTHPEKPCTCSASVVARYWQRISGPLLDRIDLQVAVGPPGYGELDASPSEETSASVRTRIVAARALQTTRFLNHPGVYGNAHMDTALVQRYCPLPRGAGRLLRDAMETLHLSARAYDRVRKIARTIADLEASAGLEPAHIAEALQFRSLDRER
jgi:magnesium chelatase family protein